MKEGESSGFGMGNRSHEINGNIIFDKDGNAIGISTNGNANLDYETADAGVTDTVLVIRPKKRQEKDEE